MTNTDPTFIQLSEDDMQEFYEQSLGAVVGITAVVIREAVKLGDPQPILTLVEELLRNSMDDVIVHDEALSIALNSTPGTDSAYTLDQIIRVLAAEDYPAFIGTYVQTHGDPWPVGVKS